MERETATFFENVEWKYEAAEKGNCRRHGLFIELFNNLTSPDLVPSSSLGVCTQVTVRDHNPSLHPRAEQHQHVLSAVSVTVTLCFGETFLSINLKMISPLFLSVMVDVLIYFP